MLFDLRPKERRDELFDREEELEILHRLVGSEWIVILGRRMMGKTSLLKTFLHEVDGIYINLSGVRSVKGLVEELMKYARKLGVEVSVGPLTISWSRLAEDVFSKFDGKVIGFDEAQDLPVNYTLKLLKKVWDTYDIRIIFTGSMVGLITGLLEPTPHSPLYGRQPAKITLKPFTHEQSLEFLSKGFRECKLDAPLNELEEAIDLLGGYPGWLAYYGNMRCVRRLTHKEALEQVYQEGKQILLEELKKFLESRKIPEKYIKLLKLLPARWSELKNAMNINSKVLSDMIQNLEKAIIIEKKGDTYTIPDPIMRNLIFEL
ncbi:MAG: ATP-binding protein [Ignisphaera sp.]|uniref:ATP-binding protein n=1 Tax=Ignisphaera aggregans TaxID=334771 RepID=A0A7J3MY76_9CREN